MKRMKYYLTTIFLLHTVSACLGQDTTQAQNDPVTECILYFVDDAKKAQETGDDKMTEVGRFLPRFGGEGTFSFKRFRIPKTKLFVFGSVNYEDDLKFDDSLHDAMTIGVRVTRSASQNPKSWIAGAEMQIEYTNNFNAANLDILVNRQGKYSAVRMSCQRKK
jgi:hypothetical protein